MSLEDEISAVGMAARLNGLYPMSPDDRADFVLRQMLDGTTVGDGNRRQVKDYLADHFRYLSEGMVAPGDTTERARAIYDTAMIHGTRGWSKFMGEQAIASIIPQIETALVYVIADALTATEDGATQRERERCAQIAKKYRTEAELERHKAVDGEDKACWLWAFDTSNAIERDIRALTTEATPGER